MANSKTWRVLFGILSVGLAIVTFLLMTGAIEPNLMFASLTACIAASTAFGIIAGLSR